MTSTTIASGAKSSELAVQAANVRSLIISFFIGAAIPLLAFWMMVSYKYPWQLNFVLAPGALIALVIGFIIHYGDPWYGLTLLGANFIFYSALTYVLVRRDWLNLRRWGKRIQSFRKHAMSGERD